jgi:hypothetical protein
MRASIFHHLYVDMRDLDLAPSQLWSAQMPTVRTWPLDAESKSGATHNNHRTELTLVRPDQVPVRVEKLHWGTMPELGHMYLELSRHAANLRYYKRSHCRLQGFLSKRFKSGAVQLCPRQSYLFYYFNFVMGQIDLYNAAPLFDPRSEGGNVTSYQWPYLRGLFSSPVSILSHLKELEKMGTKSLPPWCRPSPTPFLADSDDVAPDPKPDPASPTTRKRSRDEEDDLALTVVGPDSKRTRT